MKRFDKDVDINEKIIELDYIKDTLLYLSIYKDLKIKILQKWNA